MVAGLLLVCAAAAQLPRIGDIDFYGLRKITAEQILGAAGLAPGDTIPASRGNLEDQIADMPGVAAAHVQVVCCEGNRAALFIGIVEDGELQPAFHSTPSGPATLPQELMDSYREFLGAALRAPGKGIADENPAAGHALMANPAVRAFEDRFLAFADGHTDDLRAVLHDGSEPEERAAAATVIGYATDKKDVADDLLFAIQDPDEGVRAGALRALAAIAVAARNQPAPGIRLASTGLVKLLSSVVLSDRVESAEALLILTEGGDAAALDLIRERALASVVEMARWKTRSYALPPLMLLGRVAGLTDAQTRQSWENGDREPVIQKALETAAKKRPE
jgi:hypothetical protein